MQYSTQVVLVDLTRVSLPAVGPEDGEKHVSKVGFQPSLPRPGASRRPARSASPFPMRIRASADEHELAVRRGQNAHVVVVVPELLVGVRLRFAVLELDRPLKLAHLDASRHNFAEVPLSR